MSLFSRIRRIIQANLRIRREDEVEIDESVWEELHRSRREYAGQPGRDDSSHPPHDPELARLYANLEVPYGSDLETVTQSWKRMLRQYHPDMHSGDPEKQQVANQLVQELNRSYEELKKRLRKK